MEATTPNKKQIPTSVSADADATTPFSLSRFEDSPVFNYIKNLSPFEPIDSIRNDRTFNSLNLASPSLASASPPTSSHMETRFLIGRHQFSGPLKPEFPCGRSENNTNEAVSGAAQLPGDLCNEQLGCFTPSSEPPIEQLELAIELPTTSNNDSGSPDSEVMPCDATRTEAELEMAGSITPLILLDKDNSKERQHMLEHETDLRKIRRLEQTDEAAGLDWVTLVSDVADLLNFNSWIIEERSEGQKAEDPGTISFVSTVLDLPQDNTDDMVNLLSDGLADSCKQGGIRDPVAQLLETQDTEGEDEVPVTLSSNITGLVVNDSPAKEDVKGAGVSHSACERSMRRRCLIFEMAGAHKRKSLCDSDLSSSTSSQSVHKVPETEKHLVSSKAGSNHRSSMLTGIGIHLNALASSSNTVKLVKSEALAIGRPQEQREPRYANTVEPMTSGLTVLIESSPPRLMDRDVIPGGDEFKVMGNAFQTSLSFVSKEIDHNSPEKKRNKLELVGESLACKRCNCKRSKCLKLYCECFAAGLYCVEPCSCQDCFNNPVHEKTVLETRSQIESRNPLAFAPKVIRSTDSVYENGDETNKTPASARHKRGCFCKRSSCLKKYCECFQGGVGCSISCRCQGCKNTFGCRDAEETEFEEEETEVNDKNASERSVHDGQQQKSDSSDLPVSSEIFRSSTLANTVGPSSPLCNSQKFGKPDIVYVKPVFEKNLEVIPKIGAPKILKNNYAPTSDVKSVSPKCKRISPALFQPGSTAWRRKKLILKSVPTFPSLGPQ
ncbi:protein tesmin/TSO1-like CXC 3 [Tripterygium wilfordii]|uniref:Protein tesmin/TSO1-like CXC 3 n=1 Tax=Tripterygium wilfordii TaxID=458696 RepID=A0A7J7CZX0_TRIWF|nr:CRC domain-containing protein TSO1-like isoform X2 [Tripterygium wilfordii]KAF5739529.1 protein tesmin/TSO1-like CXC 3 [Tripterygium wilfordii]